MSKKESKYNSKEKLLKLKVPLLISPNTQKKYNNIIKLNIEPKRIYQETEYNLSKNKIKQKLIIPINPKIPILKISILYSIYFLINFPK